MVPNRHILRDPPRRIFDGFFGGGPATRASDDT
jgi:hypothetical protein